MTLSGVLLAIFCNVLWGTAIPFIKMGTGWLSIGSDIGSQFLFAGIRFFLSGIMLFSYALLVERKVPTIKREHRLQVFWILLFGTILQYACNYSGIPNIRSADGCIFSSLSGFFTVLIAPLFFVDDRLTSRKIIGVIIGFAGVLLASLKGTGISIALNGEALLILGSLCAVASNFITKRLGGRETSLSITAYNLFIGGAVLAIIGFFLGGHFGSLNVKGILCLLYLSLLSALAFTIWAELLKRYQASRLGIFTMINPVVGTIVAAIFVGESLEMAKYVASLLLVSIGIIIINLPKKSGATA